MQWFYSPIWHFNSVLMSVTHRYTSVVNYYFPSISKSYSKCLWSILESLKLSTAWKRHISLHVVLCMIVYVTNKACFFFFLVFFLKIVHRCNDMKTFKGILDVTTKRPQWGKVGERNKAFHKMLNLQCNTFSELSVSPQIMI